MSLFFCSLGHIHENLLTMSLFFCFPGHICQKKRYMSHCRRHKGHNRAKIFYMSPNKKITLFHQSQYKITAIKSYFCSSTDFRSL